MEYFMIRSELQIKISVVSLHSNYFSITKMILLYCSNSESIKVFITKIFKRRQQKRYYEPLARKKNDSLLGNDVIRIYIYIYIYIYMREIVSIFMGPMWLLITLLFENSIQ